MKYIITSLVKDKTVKKALEEALANDGKIDPGEVVKIIKSTGNKVSYQEFKDIQVIVKKSKSIDHNSKLKLLDFLGEHYYYNLLTKVKDRTVKKALAKGLYGDGTLNYEDVKNIIVSTEDGAGLTAPEYDDLKTIMNNATIVGADAKNYFRKYFKQHFRPLSSTSIKIAWGAKVSSAFKSKVIKICKDLGVNPDYLMACMAFETGETFSPSIKNAAGSGATGLIQFMPATAKGLGTTTANLEKMTAVDQLDYVKKYFLPYSNKLKTLEDVYMAILYPAAIGKSASHTLFEKGREAYTQNIGFDKNTDGKITSGEISATVRAKYNKGLQKGYVG